MTAVHTTVVAKDVVRRIAVTTVLHRLVQRVSRERIRIACLHALQGRLERTQTAFHRARLAPPAFIRTAYRRRVKIVAMTTVATMTAAIKTAVRMIATRRAVRAGGAIHRHARVGGGAIHLLHLHARHAVTAAAAPMS